MESWTSSACLVEMARQTSGATDRMSRQISPEDEDDGDVDDSVNFVAGGFVAAVSKVMVYPMETKVLLMALGDTAVNDASRLWHGVWVKGSENFMYNGLLWYLKEKLPPNFLGAFAASCAAIVLAHPSSNVVVGMQASLRLPKPSSALEVSRSLLKEHGLGGFFLGWRFSLALRVGSAMTLVVYEFVRSRLSGVLGNDIANFVAGLLGRLSEVYAFHPVKVLRSRQQSGKKLLPSFTPAAVLGLWTGVGTMAAADAVKIGIRFLITERLRHILQALLKRRRRQQRSAQALSKATVSIEQYPQAAIGG